MKKVVLDPGHGGGDSGAVSANNIRESDINLAVVLAAMASDCLSFSLFPTRHSDEYLSLSERCEIANQMEADLFVSVHSNSCGSPDVRGLEVYCYPGAMQGDILARDLGFRLRAAWYEIVIGGIPFRGIKTAPFYVLRHTDMPAALVELGFVSNDEEAQLLASPSSQRALAAAIVAGIEDFFI